MTNENELPAAAAEPPQEPGAEESQHTSKARKGRRKPAESHAIEAEGPDVFDDTIAARHADQAERERRAAQLREPGDRSARRHPNLRSIAIDLEAGIRLEEEENRVPGQTTTRLLLTCDADKKPSKDESTLLQQEGFRFDPTISSWTMPATPPNRLLAQHAYNGLLESRGFERQIAVPAR